MNNINNINKINELIENCLPAIYNLKKSGGRYSITIGGSRGKELSDSKSDVDFRLYADDFSDGGYLGKEYAEMQKLIEYWSERGLIIDGVWMRKISEIDDSLNRYHSSMPQ
jgi:hypothetical protein